MLVKLFYTGRRSVRFSLHYILNNVEVALRKDLEPVNAAFQISNDAVR